MSTEAVALILALPQGVTTLTGHIASPMTMGVVATHVWLPAIFVITPLAS